MAETVAHFILRCPVYQEERTILFKKAYEAKAQFTLLKILTDMRIMLYTAEVVILTGRNILTLFHAQEDYELHTEQSHGVPRKTTTVKSANIKPYTHTHSSINAVDVLKVLL